MGKTRVGTSGWNYDEWKGTFYPEDLPEDDQLAFAATTFDTLEVNGTFYGLTHPGAVRRWRDAAPTSFVYALKGSRFITHNKRLKNARGALANFFASGILELGAKLGPILWQLPPSLQFDGERLDRFLQALPHETSDAVELAQDHDDRVEDVSYGDGVNHRLRHVLEFRHESFLRAETARVAQRHGVALCFSHSTVWPYVEEITAGFVYLRLHGPAELYASRYGDAGLRRWADRIAIWREGGQPDNAERISDIKAPEREERDVYVYFDNTARAHAPSDAITLRNMIQ